jgi:hypothetical protein
VSVLTEKMSRDPGLGTNLRPFARTDLSESDRVKSGGIVTTKLVLLAKLVWLVAGEMGRLLNKELNLEALLASRNE